ncbi:hypothetical protein V8C35DRAFT_297983 [Trichoderma chlorosporum]
MANHGPRPMETQHWLARDVTNGASAVVGGGLKGLQGPCHAGGSAINGQQLDCLTAPRITGQSAANGLDCVAGRPSTPRGKRQRERLGLLPTRPAHLSVESVRPSVCPSRRLSAARDKSRKGQNHRASTVIRAPAAKQPQSNGSSVALARMSHASGPRWPARSTSTSGHGVGTGICQVGRGCCCGRLLIWWLFFSDQTLVNGRY